MNNSQVAHVWAQQAAARGGSGNLYFEGATIYSYGSHFPIARFIEREGKRAVLFTLAGYSMSTSRHISYVRGALYGLNLPVFNVPKVVLGAITDSGFKEAFPAYRARVNEMAADAARSRLAYKSESRIGSARSIAEEANAYAAFFGLRSRITVPDLTPQFIVATREKLRKMNAAKRAAQIERAISRACGDAWQKIQRYQQTAKVRAILPEWYAGQHDAAAVINLGEDLLRVRGDIIETSRGAEFPVAHGVRAFPLIQRIRERGEAWRANGHTIHVGHFSISEVDASGNVRAGCHRIAWSEIERCARVLGLVAGVQS